MTAEEKQKYKEYQKNYREAKKQKRKIIDVFLKTNDKEYENFINDINNIDIKVIYKMYFLEHHYRLKWHK